jgi:hypothetical protein
MKERPWPILTGLQCTFLERGYPISEQRREWGREGERGRIFPIDYNVRCPRAAMFKDMSE